MNPLLTPVRGFCTIILSASDSIGLIDVSISISAVYKHNDNDIFHRNLILCMF